MNAFNSMSTAELTKVCGSFMGFRHCVFVSSCSMSSQTCCMSRILVYRLLQT